MRSQNNTPYLPEHKDLKCKKKPLSSCICLWRDINISALHLFATTAGHLIVDCIFSYKDKLTYFYWENIVLFLSQIWIVLRFSPSN